MYCGYQFINNHQPALSGTLHVNKHPTAWYSNCGHTYFWYTTYTDSLTTDTLPSMNSTVNILSYGTPLTYSPPMSNRTQIHTKFDVTEKQPIRISIAVSSSHETTSINRSPLTADSKLTDPKMHSTSTQLVKEIKLLYKKNDIFLQKRRGTMLNFLFIMTLALSRSCLNVSRPFSFFFLLFHISTDLIV